MKLVPRISLGFAADSRLGPNSDCISPQARPRIIPSDLGGITPQNNLSTPRFGEENSALRAKK